MTQGSETEQLVRSAHLQRQEAVRQRERVVARQEQHRLDAEVDATRRTLLRLARRAGPRSYGFLDPDFLAVADRATVGQAIIEAATALSGVFAADLQACEPRDGTLRIEASRGFAPAFLDHFDTLRNDQPTACVLAWTSGRPVLVDRVHRSEVFTESTAMEAVMAAGTRAVYSFPLLTDGTVVGVLSLHGRRPIAMHEHASAMACGAAVAWSTVVAQDAAT